MLAVNPLIDTALMACRDPGVGVDRLRLVHGEEDLHFLEEILPGDAVSPESTVVGIHSKASGELLVLEHRLIRDKKTVVFSRSTYFIRAASPPTKPPGIHAKTPKPLELANSLFSTKVNIPSELPNRYATASRDFNPIHTDEEYAKKAGLPGCILHGLCTMAIAANQAIDHLAERETTQLSRLAVRFSNLVLPGDTLSIHAHFMDESPPEPSQNEAGFRLTVLNQRHEQVLTKARAYIRQKDTITPMIP
jgi:acyl dehydratase